MTVDRWLEESVRDARARGVQGAVPVLEAFARLMRVLREAPWNDDAARPGAKEPTP